MRRYFSGSKEPIFRRKAEISGPLRVKLSRTYIVTTTYVEFHGFMCVLYRDKVAYMPTKMPLIAAKSLGDRRRGREGALSRRSALRPARNGRTTKDFGWSELLGVVTIEGTFCHQSGYFLPRLRAPNSRP
jgi:hypothetical protein